MDKVIPVKVALRIRPLVSREKADACTECLRTVDSTQVILGKDKPFTYDNVFSKLSPQVEIYETAVQPLLTALFKGYNATVLAYGQTGSGKTYTMGTSYSTLCAANTFLNNNTETASTSTNFDEVGVIPRVLNDLFQKIEEEQRIDKDKEFEVKVSFVEVYNEEIKDLFNTKSTSNNEPLNIREENNTIRVAGLSEIVVTNALNTIELLEKGSSLRVVGGTAMNDQSSRSHAIFTITLEQSNSSSKNNNELIKSKFHLVDLAGSERQSKTKAEGLRLKEGININLGLLALGNVISVLGEDNPTNKPKHVPYRESKLTRLLQDSLGGNSHTLMIACASPADSNCEETLNTLRYADRARKIKNKPIVNIDPQAAELATLRQQVQDLKAQIFQLTNGVGVGENFNFDAMNTNNSDFNQIKDECEKLKVENLKMVSELTRLINVNHRNYERIQQLELEKEEQKRKFDEIKSIFDKLSKDNDELLSSQSLDQTLNVNNHNSSKALLNEMQNKIGEFEKLRDKEQTNLIQNNENDELNSVSNEPADKDYALRQAQYQFQLGEFDNELMKKQYLHQKMLENLTQLSSKDTKLESNMDELKSRIDSLEKEKEDLMDQIRTSDRKQSEQKCDRLKQLEQEVADLKRKEKDTQKMIKIKEENEKQCEKLRQEIQHIKQERVKLIKQMKQETDAFRKYKQEKEKEVNHLKALDRKRMVEITKLQEGNNRQEAILRRKNEQISRIQKQLRETSEKQKIVAEKRQQTFDRKENSSLGDKLRSWITQELELSVGLAEARINLNILLAERKETAAELAKLQEELNKFDELMPPPKQPSKRKFDTDTTYIAGSSVGSSISSNCLEDDENQLNRLQLEQRIERIKEDIEMKSVQINEIQQMVIEGDQDDRAKHLFNNIHGLLEAKVLIKHLYSSGVQYLLDCKLKQTQFETNTTGLTQELKEIKKKYESIEEECNKSQKLYNNEKTQLIQHYEQRILVLLNSAVNNAECPDDARFAILLEQISQLEKDRDTFDSNEKSSFKRMYSTNTAGNSHGLKVNRFATDLTNSNKEDFKRIKKIKRDHRRTRVIRTTPLEEEELAAAAASGTNSFGTISEVQSPMTCGNLSSCTDDISTPGDDRVKDPDWGQTPLKVKSKINKPSMSRRTSSGNLRKTRSNSRLITSFDINEANNDENANI